MELKDKRMQLRLTESDLDNVSDLRGLTRINNATEIVRLALIAYKEQILKAKEEKWRAMGTVKLTDGFFIRELVENTARALNVKISVSFHSGSDIYVFYCLTSSIEKFYQARNQLSSYISGFLSLEYDSEAMMAAAKREV